jgi:hypothetical protein
MTTLLILMMWYGLAFGFQNKLVFLHDRFGWLDALLQCSYCAGFHAGWVSYLIIHAPEVIQGTYGFAALPAELATWAFAAAAWCYAIDILLQAVEVYAEGLQSVLSGMQSAFGSISQALDSVVEAKGDAPEDAEDAPEDEPPATPPAD